jgi:hypothetical protein
MTEKPFKETFEADESKIMNPNPKSKFKPNFSCIRGLPFERNSQTSYLQDGEMHW